MRLIRFIKLIRPMSLIGLMCLMLGIGALLLFSRDLNQKPNLSIREHRGGVYAYSNENRELQTDFFSKQEINHLFTLRDGETQAVIGLSLEQRGISQKNTAPEYQLHENTDVIAKNVFPHTDIRYRIIPQGVKEDIILQSKKALQVDSTTYIFLLKLSNLTVEENQDGFILPRFVHKESGAVYNLLPPYMLDAKGVRSEDIGMTITEGDEKNTYRILLTPNEEWLRDESRAYPVTIDPTVTKGNAPVAEWTFDEAYGTTAYDNSGNANDLTITGPTWTKTSNHNIPTSVSLQYDGTDDYSSRAYDADFDFGTGSFSISGWFKHSSTQSGTDTLLARYSGAGFKIYMDSSGYICFGIDDDSTWTPDDSACSGATQGSYADSKWHHVEVVKSGTSSITLYIDGRQIVQDASLAATGSLSGTSPVLYAGIDSDGSSNPWTGWIDNLTIYNYARDANQVKADILNTPQTQASFGGATRDTLTDGLVGWWKLDESSGNAADSSGNGTTLTNVSTTAYSAAKFGNGIEPDGTADYLNADDNAVLSVTGSLTLAAWIEPDDVTGTENIIAKWDGANESYRLTKESAEVRMYIDSDSNYQATTGSPLAANTKAHVVGVYDAAGATVTIFINGQIAASSTTGTIPSSIGDDAGKFHLGAEDSTTTAANFFDGHIDEARIYNRALTPSEVELLYNFAPGTVGYWPMDENTGTSSVNDRSGNSNTLTMGGSMTASDWVPGKYGSALEFDGTDDYISRADDSDFDFTTTDSFTAASWFKKDTGGGGDSISFANLGTSANPDINDATNATSYANSSWTPPTEGLIVLFVFSRNVDGLNTISSVTGNGITWTQIATVAWDSASSIQRLTLFGANASGSSAGVTTIDYGANEQLGASASFFHATGVDLSGGVAAAFVQAPTNSSGLASPATSGSVTLSAAADSNNRAIAAFMHVANEGTTERTNWTEVDDLAGSAPLRGTETQYRSDAFETTASASWTTSARWGGIAAELKVSTGQIMAKYESTGADGGYKLYMESDGDITCGVDTDNSSFPLDSVTSTAATYDDDAWHHVACVKDGSSNLHLYIDGVLITTDSSLTASGSYANDDPLYIGIDGDGTSNAWLGELDDIRVYNYARTPEQIIEDLNAGHPAPGSPVGSSVGYWKFDEGALNTCSGGTNDYCDSTPNGNDLAFSTTTGGFTNSGKFGKALDGDGSVWASRADDADFDFTASEDLTISGWFQHDTASAVEVILQKYETTGADGGYLIRMESDGDITFGIDDDNSGPTDTATSTAATYDDNTWHHVAAVKNGTTNIQLYIDGVLITTTTVTETGSLANDDTLYIADSDGSNGTDEFNGQLDELKIYRLALNADQVKVDFNHGKATVLGSLSTDASGNADNSAERAYCPPGDATASCAPVAEWKMDENTGTSANDTSGNGNTGTLTSGPTWIRGKHGSALKLNGSGAFIDVSVALGTSFTISGWIYPDSPTNSYSCIAANTTNLAFCLRGSDAGGDSGLLTYYYSGVDHQSTTALSFNQWHYVSLVNDNGNVTFYVDGQKNGTAASGPSITVEYLGATDNAGEYFKGSLDTIRLYDYARTAAQIAWEYNQGGPIAWYKFDECSGATANNSAPAADGDAGLDGTIFAGDSSGTNDSVGSCNSGASSPTDEMWDEGTTGKINASLDFDNTNDYVQISDDAALDFVDGESFTITAWVKASTLSDNNAIVSKKNGVGTSSVGYMLYVNTSGQLGTYISESATDNVNLFTDTTIAAGSWYHVALVYEDDTDLNIYINGVDGGGTVSGTIANVDSIANAVNFVIGSESDLDVAFMDGQLDEIKLFRYELTEQQIRNDYAGGAVRFE